MKRNYRNLLKSVERFYDKVGPKYELIYPNLNDSNKLIADSLVQNGFIKNNSNIADLACSCGWLLHEINKVNPKSKLYGYDISNESITFAKENISKNDNRISFRVADWLSIENNYNDKYDLALCIGNSLTHFPFDIQTEILYSFSKLIKSGGILIVDSYKDWNSKLRRHYEIEPKGLTRFKEIDVVTYFFSVYTKEIAERNICFATYNSKDQNSIKLRDFEHYITYQFPFIIDSGIENEMFGFSKIEKIKIHDGIGIFKYYKLIKL
jgi:ubiquinone/menaquinone biosynthesis C-methylase UbiE